MCQSRLTTQWLLLIIICIIFIQILRTEIRGMQSERVYDIRLVPVWFLCGYKRKWIDGNLHNKVFILKIKL